MRDPMTLATGDTPATVLGLAKWLNPKLNRITKLYN